MDPGTLSTLGGVGFFGFGLFVWFGSALSCVFVVGFIFPEQQSSCVLVREHYRSSFRCQAEYHFSTGRWEMGKGGKGDPRHWFSEAVHLLSSIWGEIKLLYPSGYGSAIAFSLSSLLKSSCPWIHSLCAVPEQKQDNFLKSSRFSLLSSSKQPLWALCVTELEWAIVIPDPPWACICSLT